MSPAKNLPHFKTIAKLDVPKSRNGKHKQIVTEILEDLNQLEKGSAIKLPLKALSDSKENIRSALNRATRKASRVVQTASDEQFLYIWNAEAPPVRK